MSLRNCISSSTLFWKLALAAMALMWGFSFVVVKDVTATVPTFFLLTVRFLGAALLLFVIFHKQIMTQLNKHTIGVGVVMGIFMGAAYALQTLGILDTTAGKNAFLTGTYCVIVPFISFFMMGEPLTRFNLGAALLCISGIALVALDDFSIQLGDLLTLCCAVFFAFQIVVAAKYGSDIDVYVSTFWMDLTVGIGTAVVSIVVEPSPLLLAWSPQLVGVLVFLSVGCTCLALLVQNQGLARVPASAGSLLLSLEAPWGVLFSVLLMGEPLTARLLLGFALIFAAIVVSEVLGHSNETEAAVPELQEVCEKARV